jgi:glycosyltransferase involved in cell wall biosynthesis
MKIGFASNDWSRSMHTHTGLPVMGGSGHIRIGQYINPLRKRGIDVVLGILAHNNITGTFGIHSWDNTGDHFDCDVIIMQRYMHKQVLPDMIRAQMAGQIIFQDVDDWYWGLSKKNAAYSASNPKLNLVENVDWYRKIIEQSDGVITSTPFLRDKMLEWNDNVGLQTNYVNTAQFRNVSEFVSDDPIRKLVVGWMGSTAHRSGDLEILKPFANKVAKFARFHHTGDIKAPNIPRFHKEMGLSAGVVSTSPFLPPHSLQDGFLFNVGIVPLTDIPFNHAKSYIKGLEYAAAGIPFVASWSPQYEELVETHGIGLLARKPSEYVSLLGDLLDHDYRKEQAASVRQKVKQFDVKVGAGNLYNLIKKMYKEAWNEKR